MSRKIWRAWEVWGFWGLHKPGLDHIVLKTFYLFGLRNFWHSPKILSYSFDNKFIGFILACIHVHIFQFISLALKIIDSG
ncbi:MAG: hypothetical protein LHW51_09955, partial [Candidatus Cloacimonetes bacterium]|nr:hypothetical protein [Candidatus Cloacimonadota bacterium]MCK9242657.1 hypothetical protein [Candidatus Cloacimonadota bacterium]